MDALMVRATDKGSFLARVVAHAVTHNILTEDRRRALAREAAEYLPIFCAKVGLNAKATAELMAAAKMVENLLSVGLGMVSRGNVEVAAVHLREQNLSGVIVAALTRLTTLHDQATRFLTEATKVFRIPSWEDREVNLRYVRDETTEWAGVVMNKVTIEVEFPKLCEHVTTLAELERMEALQQASAEELRVSKTFLPWAEFKQELRMVPVRDRSITGDGHEFNWGVHSLLATLALTLQFKGPGRGTALIGWPTFQRRMRELKTTTFRERALAVGRKYLLARTPRPNDAELALLMDMWAWALDDLVAAMPAEKFWNEPGNWADRVHLRMTPAMVRETVRALMRQEIARPARAQLDDLKGLFREAVKKSGMLKRLDWSEVRDDGDVSVLLMHLCPADVIPHLPLDQRLIALLVQGWDNWEPREWRALVRRLIKEAEPEFWLRLKPDMVERLRAEMQPAEQAKIDRFLRVRKG